MSRSGSLRIEWQVRRSLNCERHDFAEVADADFISNGNAFTAIVAALAPHYAVADDALRNEIDELLYECKDLRGVKERDNSEVMEQASIKLKALLDKLNVPELD